MENETEKTTTNVVSWTWADQISSYKFWGIFLFFILLMIPGLTLGLAFPMFYEDFGMSASQIGTALSIKTFAGFGGLWLAWFMVRLKNHYLLFLYSFVLIIGLMIIIINPSFISILIGLFLIGLSLGAICLAVPSIIAGGRGGSEMFVISFGLIASFEVFASVVFIPFFGRLLDISHNPRSYIIICLVISFIGTLLLLPVKSDLFNTSPPERKMFLTPIRREPVIVALLCLVPLYNIYYILNLTYRLENSEHIDPLKTE
jgi:predicted MFS family arabinose efflux permease